jgi:kinesin family protein 18/19
MVQLDLERHSVPIFCNLAYLLFIAMLGTPDKRGVMVQALEKLFDEVTQDKENTSKITISYCEAIIYSKNKMNSTSQVYNEYLRDLLAPGGDNLELREDPIKGISVAGLILYLDFISHGNLAKGIKEFVVSTVEEVMALLHRGNRNRYISLIMSYVNNV